MFNLKKKIRKVQFKLIKALKYHKQVFFLYKIYEFL